MHSQFVDLDELEDDLEVLQNFNFPVKIFWWPVDQLIQTFDRKMQFWKSGQKFSKEKWRWRCSRKLHFPAKRKCSGGGRRNLEKWTFDQKILTGKLILIFGQKFSDEKFNCSYTSFPPENWKWVYGVDFTSSEEFDRKINFDFWAEIFWGKVQFFLWVIFAGKFKIGVSTWFHFLRKFWPQNQFWKSGQKFSEEKFNSSYTSFLPQNPKLLLSTWFHFLRKFWPQNQFWKTGQKFSEEKFNSS